jgi:hypothetical protein
MKRTILLFISTASLICQTPYHEEHFKKDQETRIYVAKRLTERRKEKKIEDNNKEMIYYFTLGKYDEILCMYSDDGPWKSRSVDTYLDEEETSDNIYWCDGVKVWKRYKFKTILFLHKPTKTDKQRDILTIGRGANTRKLLRFAEIDVESIR